MRSKRQLRKRIRQIVCTTPFKNQDKIEMVELILLRAIERIVAEERRTQWLQAQQAIARSRGRPNQTPNRTILTAAIFRAWQVGQSKKPVINKRLPGAIPSPFVVFATKVYLLLHIFNTIDNLDHYRSLGNQLEKNDFVQYI